MSETTSSGFGPAGADQQQLQMKELADRVGTHLGYSEWFEMTQDKVDLFADATGDHQWIHVDTQRAAQGPFGQTIAHGYFTLSLLPSLLHQVFEVSDASLVVNYGANKVRFPAPLPVGRQVRLGVELAALDEFNGGLAGTIKATFEVSDQAKPACVAEILFRFYE